MNNLSPLEQTALFRMGLEPILTETGQLISGFSETQVLHISVQRELSERQSDRQEIDLLISFGKRLQENEV